MQGRRECKGFISIKRGSAAKIVVVVIGARAASHIAEVISGAGRLFVSAVALVLQHVWRITFVVAVGGVNVVASRVMCIRSTCAAHSDLVQHGTGLCRITWAILEYNSGTAGNTSGCVWGCTGTHRGSYLKCMYSVWYGGCACFTARLEIRLLEQMGAE